MNNNVTKIFDLIDNILSLVKYPCIRKENKLLICNYMNDSMIKISFYNHTVTVGYVDGITNSYKPYSYYSFRVYDSFEIINCIIDDIGEIIDDEF